MDSVTVIICFLVIILILFSLIVVLAFFSQRKAEKDEKEIDSYERFHEIDLAIERAIKNHDFEILYQPIFDLKKETIVACEALLRLNDDELGILIPDVFIPVAEKTGKITELGNVVFKGVCDFIRNTNLQSYPISYVEVNLSIMECLQTDLPQRISEILDFYGIKRDFISLEIKESAISLKNKTIQDNINALHEMGIGLTLDDYGTGNSTLAYVMALPFRGVKIDRTLLWKAMKSQSAMYALCANISTLKDMDTTIMVEGAESEDMVENLKTLQCDYVQGFYFATPMHEQEFIEFLSQKD